MLPSNSRLLNGARQALASLENDVAPGAKETLNAIDCVLVEMLLRDDRHFYRRYLSQGIALVKKGVGLADHSGIDLPLPANAMDVLSSDDLSTDALFARIEITLRALEDIVRTLATWPLASGYLSRVVDFENSFHRRHADFPTPTAPTKIFDFTPANLLAYLQQKQPDWPNIVVREVSVLPGGFSKKTVLLDIRDDKHGDQAFVLRVEQPQRFDFWDGDQVVNEFPTLQLIHEAGLLVPEPLWLEADPRWLGQRFIVSRRARGQNIGNSVGTKARLDKNVVRDAIRHLVRIHHTRLDKSDPRIRNGHLAAWSRFATVRESTRAWVEHWIARIHEKQLRPSPLTVRMMEWLRANVPDSDEPPSLLHGDFGLHNTLFEDGRVSAILDWEYLTFGDPAEDIALLGISLGGQLSQDEIVVMYVEAGGHPIPKSRLLYNDVIYAMKFIVPSENSLKIFEDHEESNIGLCKMGFTFTVAGVSALNEKIALAEAARKDEQKMKGTH